MEFKKNVMSRFICLTTFSNEKVLVDKNQIVSIEDGQYDNRCYVRTKTNKYEMEGTLLQTVSTVFEMEDYEVLQMFPQLTPEESEEDSDAED